MSTKTISELSTRIRNQIYDSVWIEEDEYVYRQKTEGIVENRVDEFLDYLVDAGYIKWLKNKPR